MTITIELPSAIEEKLRLEKGDLAAVSKEAILIELYEKAGSRTASWPTALVCLETKWTMCCGVGALRKTC